MLHQMKPAASKDSETTVKPQTKDDSLAVPPSPQGLSKPRKSPVNYGRKRNREYEINRYQRLKSDPEAWEARKAKQREQAAKKKQALMELSEDERNDLLEETKASRRERDMKRRLDPVKGPKDRESRRKAQIKWEQKTGYRRHPQ